MIKILVVFFILVAITGCGQHANRRVKPTGIISPETFILGAKPVADSLSDVVLNTDVLPFGVKLLITTNFPKYWQTQLGKHAQVRSQEKYQVAYDSVYFTLNKHTNRVLYPEKHYNSKLSTHKNTYEEKDIRIKYYDNLYHVFDNVFQNENYLSPFARFRISNNVTLVLFAKENDSLKKYRIEYPYYGYGRMDAVILQYGRVQDTLNLYYDVSFSYGGYNKFFYIDENAIIHIKYFMGDEIYTHFTRYLKYKISPQGNFIRYYAQNGMFSSDEERGLVKNHTREGVWIEMRRNEYVSLSRNFEDSYTYLEAHYKDGLPVGVWRFYKLEREYDEESGRPVLSSRRKGELLYTETYENGRLVSRESRNS